MSPINQQGNTSTGSVGPQGPPGMMGEDGQEGLMGFPGTIGPAGATGAQGVVGPAVFLLGEEGEKGEEGFPGKDGGTGAQGPMGPPVFLVGEEGPEGLPAIISLLGGNLKFLGTASGSGVTVGPIVWFENYQFFLFAWVIAGYNGGTPVGRLLIGPGAPATASATNGSSLITDVTLNATSVSAAGMPLAVTASALARSGFGFINGASGALKQITAFGMSGNPAVATAPTQYQGRSFFSDLSTNLPIKQAQLSVYDGLTGTTISTNQFIATTQLWFWGLSNLP